MQKRKYMYGILILLVIVIGSTAGYLIMKREKNGPINDVKGNLIISTFSESTKGNMILYDVDKSDKTPLVSDSEVAINGDLSEDGNKVVYANALNDSDPWQVYIHKMGEKSSKDKKVTDDENGKASPRFGKDNLVYYLTGDTSGLMQIGRTDTETKESILIDDKSTDCKVDAMDVIDDKIIMSSTHNNVYIKDWEENEGEDTPILHTIFEMDKDGENLKRVIEIQASSIDSISYSPSKKDCIISGCNVNDEVGEGIFKVSLETGEISTLLNIETLFLNGASVVNDFSNPNLAKMSKDESLVYFTGVLAGSDTVEIQGIECYPTAVFSYNIASNEIKKIYEPEEASFIFDLNIKY